MNYRELIPATVLHWNYRGFTEFPIQRLHGEESEITDIYLKENLISRIPSEIYRLEHLESLYLCGNDITELPREISKLRCLKCLDVSGNRLKHIPDEVGEVEGLKFLILDENELSELPLRLAELRSLQYLSVCDNKLQWLPQRPVYNYYHCEFRFWRNAQLRTIPYSLWYHMFRDQQTRSLNIGCLNIPKYQHTSKINRCRLQINTNSREWEFDVDCPPQHNIVLETDMESPSSLFEMCKRMLYQMITDAAKKISVDSFSIFSNNRGRQHDSENNNTVTNLEDNLGAFVIDNENGIDVNGNNLAFRREDLANNKNKSNMKRYYVPTDIVMTYMNFLPTFLKQDLCNGPVTRCENLSCKKPVYDYVFYEFCLGKIILIDNTEDVILSATFCSKYCADVWKRGKTNILTWKLVKDS